MSRSLASVLFLLVASASLVAQGGLGDCDLSVRILTSNERGVESPIQVQLLGEQGVLATASITGADSAHFRVASGKTYRLSVSGTSIEPITTSYFEVTALEGTHIESVYVKLNKQNSTEDSAGAATVSVSEMNIPKNASSEMKRGMDAYSKGDMESAAGHFQKAIAEYPQYARAYDMLGAIAMKGSDRVKARELFGKSIQADGGFVPAYLDLARMDLQEHNYSKSESLLEKAISLNSSMPDAIALLATTEFANGEFDKALADVQRTHALRNHEQFAEVHIMAGKVLRMQNHPDEAIVQFQLFLKEKPESPEGESVRKALASLQARQKP
jgi:tetratricopeptide (TPR) repeat protein